MMTLHIGEWIVLLMIMAMPIYSFWESDKTKRAVIAGHKTKLRMYQETMVYLWFPTVTLLALVLMQVVRISDIGLYWRSSMANWVGACLVMCLFVYLVLGVYKTKSNSQNNEELRNTMKTHSWMMPASRCELTWFTFGVSMSAGICEELLFRGFLLSVFSDYIGLFASLILSSFLFGLCHIYQGWLNAIRAGIYGLVFSGIYILTDSLLIVIILHAMLDIYSGIIGYLINQSSIDNAKLYITKSDTKATAP